jgi:hypothetical protein
MTMSRLLGGGRSVVQKSYVSIVVVLLLLLVLISTTTNIVVNGKEQCTPCNDGTDFMATATQPLCNNIVSTTNGLFDTDKECLNIQLNAYQKGCCAHPPFDYCTYCDDPLIEPDLDLYVPTGQFADPYNCYEYSFQNEAMIGVFSDGNCEDTFMRRAGHYCGCGANQQQECSLCPNGDTPTKPQRMDSWITDSNCRGIEYLFTLLKEDECASFPFSIGADLAIYCGCNGLNQTEINEQAELYTCSLCENGGVVTNPQRVYNPLELSTMHKTCSQAEDFATTIIKTPAGCRNTNYFGLAREVCTCSSSGAGGGARAGSMTTTTIMMMMMTAVAGSLLVLLL